MSSVPVFVPTAGPPVAGVVHLPDRDEGAGTAVVLLPGLEAERIRIGAVRNAAVELARRGHPVLRVDHPGAGTSPGPPPERSMVIERFRSVIGWFRGTTGGLPVAVAGTCAGGGYSLQLAATDPAIRRVVIQGGRLRARLGKERPTVAAALAAFDLLDKLPPSVAEPRGSSAVYDDDRWDEVRLEVLERAADHADVTILCGQGDALHQDLQHLLAADVLPARTCEAIEVLPLEVDRINTVMDAAQDAALTRALVARLSAPLGP